MTPPPHPESRGSPRSLRARLTLALTLGVLGLWGITIAATAYVITLEMDEFYDSALQETADRLLPLAVTDAQRSDAPALHVVDPIPEDYLSYALRRMEGTTPGQIVLTSADAAMATFANPAPEGVSRQADHRLFVRSTADGAYRIEVAEPLAYRREAMAETMMALAIPILLVLPLALIGLAVVLRRGLAGLVWLGEQMGGRGAGDLRPLPDGGLPTELAAVVGAVNGLLARLARTLDAERGFTANAAHELRTPVAAALAQVQRMLAEAPPDSPLRPRAQSIEAELRRLARLSEKLLQLARAEGRALVTDHPHDLAEVARAVIDDLSRARPDGRITAHLPAHAPLHVDPDTFGIILRNLVDNALLHGPADAPVRVAMDAAGGLSVVNGGPVVPAAELARLPTRFERARARVGGSGLGLAIVDAALRPSGGQLILHSPARGRPDGFEAEVRLPPPAEGRPLPPG